MTERRIETPPTENEGPQNTDQDRAEHRRDYPSVPMDQHRTEIVECVKKNPNVVIIGETGSGKTTRIPDFLIDSFPNARIAITQPRRVAARSVARFVAERRGEKIGQTIGYQVRFEDETNLGTRANFMTDGILLRKLQFDPLLREYDIIMVDEAHERSLNIDFILGLLKRVQAKRNEQGLKELKVIVTSATIEKEKFANYFGGAPIIEAQGRMYPVDVYYEKCEPDDVTNAAALKAREIIMNSEEGDILIFMPGEAEIRYTIYQIEELLKNQEQDVEVMPLFSTMAPEDQDRIFQKNHKRKIIVATNIAETSITIDSVRFVIDSGLIRQKNFNPNTGIETLETRRHAKSGCEQRKGRAGRTAPGICYRLYTEESYNKRDAYQTPEITRSNLDHVILAMKKIGIEDIYNFDFIDPPKKEAITQAIETLKVLGALDQNEKLTKIGLIMAELPLKPEIARMVVEAQKYGCVQEICTIAAMMGEKSVFVRPKGKETEADNAHKKFSKNQNGSDFMTLLEVWNQWAASGFNESWARNNFLNVRQLLEIREIRSQLMRELKHRDIIVNNKKSEEVVIQKCIAAGLIHYLMIKINSNIYKRVIKSSNYSSSEKIFIHPSSSAFYLTPKLIIGANLFTTSKTFTRLCQPIQPEWLIEIAPQLLKVYDGNVYYDVKTDTVTKLIYYSLKGEIGVTIEQKLPVTDDTIAAEQFARALADGLVDLPSVKHNAEVIKTLQELYIRSGGQVRPPELLTWYRERSGGVKNKKEAQYIDEQLRINIDEYCPPDMRTRIDLLYPKTITVQGHTLGVNYEYFPANPNSWSESEKVERFKAIITIPNDILFTLETNDFPPIGTKGRPKIVYCDRYYGFTNTNLEALKIEVDNRRLESVWYNFQSSKKQQIQVVLDQPLPTFESLNVHPITYAKNFKGEDLLAYPAYYAEQTYDIDLKEYTYKFFITYYRTIEEAKQQSDRAIKYKNQVDAQLHRIQERKILLAPAKERYADMRTMMDRLYDDYSMYGLSCDDYDRLSSKWREVRDSLERPDADPKKAIELMDEIQMTIEERQKERDRRIVLIPEVQARLETLKNRMAKITYDTYLRFGLSYDQYIILSNKWREANNALNNKDRYGHPILPDPERAAIILDEIAAIIPDEQQETTPEQETLISLLSDKKNSSFVKVIRVRGGRVTEFYSPINPSEVTKNPTEIPIGKSGRTLLVQGALLIASWGGRDASRWKFSDGDYLTGRDAFIWIRVEEKQGAPYGLRALEFINPLLEDDVSSIPYYEGTTSDNNNQGNGIFASLLSRFTGTQAPKQTQPPENKTSTPTPPTPPVVPEIKPIEKEKMTEELRLALMEDLNITRFFLDTIRAIPEPKQKTANADKISKMRARASELKRDLNSIEQELRTTDDAARIRGKVVDIARRAERIAEEIAKLQNDREDWPKRFKSFMAKLVEITKAQDITLDAPTLEKIKIKIAELARHKGEITDLEGEIETIIVDSI